MAIDKKALAAAYKERQNIGGVYVIRDQAGAVALLAAAPNLDGALNRFRFAQQTGSCVHPSLEKSWGDGQGFTIEVLDRLEQDPEWSRRRWQEELAALAGLWREKLGLV